LVDDTAVAPARINGRRLYLAIHTSLHRIQQQRSAAVKGA